MRTGSDIRSLWRCVADRLEEGRLGTRSSDQMEKDGGRPREEAAGVGEVVGLYMYI